MGPPAATSPGRTPIDTLLEEARAGLRRLTPEEARTAMGAGAVLIDIRSEVERAADGVVPGALFFPRNVLEWRCDPASPSHDPRVSDLDARVIVMCAEGYQSSLAASSLQRMGFRHATDLAGGFQDWRAAGLPVRPLSEGGAMRAIGFPCGHRLEARDDGELVRLCREHPELRRPDAQTRERVAAGADDVDPVA